MYKQKNLIQLFTGKKILIAGFGREGRSSYQLLRKLFPVRGSHSVVLGIADKKEQIADDPMIQNDTQLQLHLGEEYVSSSNAYDIILKSPGIPTFDFEGKVDMHKISSQTDIFLQVFGSQTIGVTGTKGKSTTTHLLHTLLSTVNSNTLIAGNMGIPLFDSIERLNKDSLLVVELSSHQLENIQVAPHIGILLNLFQEHLDHYHSYSDYQLAKLNIGTCQKKGDIFIYCSDNETLRTLVEHHPMQSLQLVYSMQNPVSLGCYRDGNYFRMMPSGEISYDTTRKRKLQGDHNLSNCMVAFLVGHCFGIADERIAAVVNSFHGLEHRLEFVTTRNDISFYNDSISTIPEATEAAVNALQHVDTLILGGFDRGIMYAGLAEFLSKSTVRNMVFVGKAGYRIYQEMQQIDALVNRNILTSDNYEEIVRWSYAHTQPGSICLLSPAASSYDSFKNFEERGAVFKKWVMSL